MNIPLFLTFTHTQWGIIDIFADFTETLTLAFPWAPFKRGFQTVHEYNPALDLSIHTRFYDLNLLQGHRCVRIITCRSFFFNYCLLSFKHCIVAIYIRKIKRSMHFVTGMYFLSILHMNVSGLSVCFSCNFCLGVGGILTFSLLFLFNS